MVLKRLAAIPGTKGEVLRFGIVGVLAAGLDFALLSGAVRLGVSPYLARIGSVAVAMTFTWWLNRNLTFAATAPPSWSEYGRYVGTSLLGSAINYGLYSGGVYIGLPLWLAFAIGTGVAAVFNFLRYRALLAPKG